MFKEYCIDKRNSFHLKDFDPDERGLCTDKKEAAVRMAANGKRLYDLQQKLYSEKKQGLILLFQAMDAAGKDGTIRAVLTALSPQGVYEQPFKAPSGEELAHDFLWRVHRAVPEKGEIAIFNRSQYEDVLIGKVRELYKKQPHAEWVKEDQIIRKRYADIRHFEEYLYNNSIRTVKFFLHVSKKEQASRFLDRLEEPEKNWKFSEGDFSERQYWDAYQAAFEDAINETATKECPWYVVPADHKWYMRYVVSEIVLGALQDMAPAYPVVTEERLATFEKYRKILEKED